MSKVITVSEISKVVTTLKKQGKTVVLVGGCFDILHPGHVVFLQKAKKEGNVLIVLLESDEKIKASKGDKRPVHNQLERAMMLSALSAVDFIVMLPHLKRDQEYDRLVVDIKPDIIAATKGEKEDHHKKRTAALTGAKLKYVTRLVGSYSSSNVLNR